MQTCIALTPTNKLIQRVLVLLQRVLVLVGVVAGKVRGLRRAPRRAVRVARVEPANGARACPILRAAECVRWQVRATRAHTQ